MNNTITEGMVTGLEDSSPVAVLGEVVNTVGAACPAPLLLPSPRLNPLQRGLFLPLSRLLLRSPLSVPPIHPVPFLKTPGLFYIPHVLLSCHAAARMRSIMCLMPIRCVHSSAPLRSGFRCAVPCRITRALSKDDAALRKKRITKHWVYLMSYLPLALPSCV